MPRMDPNAGSTEVALIQACRVVFGEQVSVTPEFLKYLQLSGLKSAFRSQAKRLHPDLQADSGDSFRELKDAYEILTRYLEGQGNPGAAMEGGSARASKERFYEGPVPRIRLEFGMYLFYRGAISSDQLFAAVRWQRGQRPALGELAKRRGWLSDQQIRTALISGKARGRFGEKCIQLQLLNEEQVMKLVYSQRVQQRKLGEFFVDNGIITHPELERLLRDCHAHNARYPSRTWSKV